MNDGSKLIIPLPLKRIVSYLSVHKPTIVELENEEKYPHIELTAETLLGENSIYTEQEEVMVDFRGQDIINPSITASKQVMISFMSASLQASATDIAPDETSSIALESNVSI